MKRWNAALGQPTSQWYFVTTLLVRSSKFATMFAKFPTIRFQPSASHQQGARMSPLDQDRGARAPLHP